MAWVSDQPELGVGQEREDFRGWDEVWNIVRDDQVGMGADELGHRAG